MALFTIFISSPLTCHRLHIESRDAAHWTALHHAAFEGRMQAVTLLLQAGADVNSADPHVGHSIDCSFSVSFPSSLFHSVSPFLSISPSYLHSPYLFPSFAQSLPLPHIIHLVALYDSDTVSVTV